MSVLNQSGEEQECPLCLEVLEVDDLHFYPCTCGYQICRFCWNRIRETENGLCPACRKAYPENPADFTPLSQEQVAAIKTEKKAREQRRRNKTLESRKQLANVRVVQNNLVFVVGLPVRLADPEILKRQEYFGKYGKIHKVVINQSTTYAGSQGPSASAYVTYVSQADALRAIQSVNNVTIDGRVLKGSLGTTKYCANFMKNQPCPKTDCMYLHELGDPNASFSKEEMHLGMHQVYERKLHEKSLAQQQSANATGNSTNGEKSSSKERNQPGFIPPQIVTSSNINIANSNSKSNKKEQPSSSGSGSKEAWPSLGSTPPPPSPPASDSSDSKRTSPKPDTRDTASSQETGTPDSSSPIQSQTKHKESKNRREREHKSKHNGTEQTTWQHGNSINGGSDDEEKIKGVPAYDAADYVLDELESDHHNLLDNHDLLDSNEHNLLEDDNHSLLTDTTSDAVMMQRHREMLASLVDNNFMGQQMKSPVVDSFGLLDGYDRSVNHRVMAEQKELLDRSRSEMLMNELLARQHLHHKQYAHSHPVDTTTQLLGNNYTAPSLLTPFGVRLDGTVPPPAPPAYLAPPARHNGYAEPQEGRYLGEHVDRFFTDFHKTQQLKYLLGKSGDGNPAYDARPKLGLPPANIMSAHQLEMEQKQRHQELLAASSHQQAHSQAHQQAHSQAHQQAHSQAQAPRHSAPAPTVDDDLDFDPFKETQKAFAEMMENELIQHGLSPSERAERVRRARLPPPGFSHMNSFGLGRPPQQQQADWTQMDPAIMSTSVSLPKASPSQPDLLQRFSSLGYQHKPQPRPLNGHQKLWGLPPYQEPNYPIPLPPGFGDLSQTGSECIESK